MSGTDLEARIIELETRCVFQEDTINQLNDALIDQQRQLDELQSQIHVLREELRERMDAASDNEQRTRDPRADIPPHY